MATPPINPIVNGILQGFEMSNVLKHQQYQQQALARQTARDAEDKQVRDLQTWMALSDRGYKRTTADQDVELRTGTKIGPAGLMPSDLNTRMTKFGGQTYVRPSDEEVDTRAQTRKTAQLRAEGDVAAETEGKKAKAKLTNTGLQMSAPLMERLGLAPGSNNMIEQGPGSAAELRAALSPAGADQVSHTVTSTNDKGDLSVIPVLKSGKMGTTTTIPGAGQTKKATREPGAMTDYQKVQIERQKQADADKALKLHADAQAKAQKEVDDLERQQQDLHQQNREIGARLIAGSKGSAKDAKGKSITVSPEDAAALKAKLGENQTKIKALFDRQHARIMQFAGSGPDGQTTAAASRSAAVPVNPY